jgi:HSP20 family protein
MYLTNLSKLANDSFDGVFDSFFNFPHTRSEWDTLGILGPEYKVGDNTLMVSLPGFSKKDINIEVDGQILTISSEKEDVGFVKAFTKKFRLPNNIDMDSLSATMKDGILTLEFNKADNTKKISIK